jgi:hypothetical protein
MLFSSGAPVPSRRKDPRGTRRDRALLYGFILPLAGMVLWFSGWSVGQAEALIENIEVFLDKCPSSDPVYAKLRADFTIRRNDVIVTNIPCSEPVSSMPLPQYTDELIVLQGLRTIYYMDLGRSGHLPWTGGTLYDWLRSKIGGINISDTAGSFCCALLNGKAYIVVRAQDDTNRDFDRAWRGIAGNISLYFHEARHRDTGGHVSCCGTASGCDSTYDESNLSPYGIQWWLNANWLTGYLYVGFSCLSPTKIQDIAYWHWTSCNFGRDRFCQTKPPTVNLPASPGGPCPLPAGPAPPTGLQIR